MASDTSEAAPADQVPTTVLDRMLKAGLSEDRARKWIEIGAVHVDGVTAENVDHPAPWPSSWVIKPS